MPLLTFDRKFVLTKFIYLYFSDFDHLHEKEKFVASTLWSYFSRLVTCARLISGKDWSNFGRLKMILKTYEKDYAPTQAKVFTPAQINDFLSHNSSMSYWLLRKAAVVCGIYGSLRSIELKSLLVENVHRAEHGFYINFQHAKNKGALKPGRFLVPKLGDEVSTCPAKHVSICS